MGFGLPPFKTGDEFMTDEKAKTVKVTCYKDVHIADDKYVRGKNYSVDAVRAKKYRTYFTDPNAK